MRLCAFFIALATSLAIASAGASAQSLSAKNAPYLLPGENDATADSITGAQYWKFKTKPGPGSMTLSVTFGSMALLGNPVTSSITLVVTAPNGKVGSSVITSSGKPVHYTFPGKFKIGGTYLVKVEPPQNTLVRSGGDYSLSVEGDIDFSSAKAVGPAAIAGTYNMMLCANGPCELLRFGKDGSVTGADGATGTWTAFDPDKLIYVINFRGYTFNEKLQPGRGLISTQTGTVDFQAQ